MSPTEPEELDEELEWVDCGECDGAGEVADDSDDAQRVWACETCAGSGRVQW